MDILAFMLGWPEIVIIMVVILLLFGGKKLPELAKGVAKGLKTFRREMDDVKGHINEAIEESENEDYHRQQNATKSKKVDTSEDNGSNAGPRSPEEVFDKNKE